MCNKVKQKAILVETKSGIRTNLSELNRLLEKGWIKKDSILIENKGHMAEVIFILEKNEAIQTTN